MTQQTCPNLPCRTESAFRLLLPILVTGWVAGCGTRSDNGAPADAGAAHPVLVSDAARGAMIEQQADHSEAQDDDQVQANGDHRDASTKPRDEFPDASPSTGDWLDASTDVDDSRDAGDEPLTIPTADASSDDSPVAPDSSVPEPPGCDGCDVNGSCFGDGAADPDNQCRRCDVTLATDAFSDADGSPCDDGLFCNGADTCRAGACTAHEGDPCPNGVECDGDEICDENGNECLPGIPTCADGKVCNLGNDSCESTCGGCLILGTCYPDGTLDPNTPCRVCRAQENPTGWSDKDFATCDDGLFCNGADTCSGGSCSAHAGDPCGDGVSCSGVESCDEVANTCSAGTTTCGPQEACDLATAGCVAICSGCLIGAMCHNDGSTNPANACQRCDIDASVTSWSDADSVACDDGLFCNGADTCSAGSCSLHAGNPCGDGVSCNGAESCDEGANQCTPGITACGQGQFCEPVTDTCASSCAGCRIGGTCYVNGATNPANLCQLCDTARSATMWSPNDGAGCSDGLYCNGPDFCGAGACSVHAGDPCSDGLSCNGTESCDDTVDQCVAGVSPCPDGESCDTQNDSCEPNCGASQYETAAPTPSSPAECSPLTDCSPGEFVTVQPTLTSDRACAACVSGYTTEPNSDQCLPWTLCTGSYLEKTAGTPTSDRTCKPEWIVQFGTDDLDQPDAVAIDAAGDALVVFRGAGIFVVVKLSGLDGSELWRRTFGDPAGDNAFAYSIGVNAYGDALVAGRTYGDFVGDGNAGGSDALVLKLSGADGAQLWAWQFGTTGDDGCYAVAVDGDGDALVTVRENAGATVSAAKLSGMDGSLVWKEPVASANNMAIDVNPVGDVVLVAASTGDLDGDGESGGAAVLKLAGDNGGPVWIQQVSASVATSFQSVRADGLGGVLAAKGGTVESIVVKLGDSDGAELWSRTVAGFNLPNVAADAEGGVLLGGSNLGSADERDSAVFKLSGDDGATLWTELFGSPLHDMARGLDARGGAIFVAGLTNGEMADGADLGGSDCFVFKLVE